MYNIIILGIILSAIYYELTDISPGGLIVPGYIAIYIMQPTRIFLTLILSLVTLVLVDFLSNYIILYGRRKFTMMVMVSFLIRLAIGASGNYIPLPAVFTTSAIGYIIPGIIAQDMGRQGAVKTISSMLLVASMISLVDILISGVVL